MKRPIRLSHAKRLRFMRYFDDLVALFVNKATHRDDRGVQPSKAREESTPSVCERRATQRGGMHRSVNATLFANRAT